MRQTKKILFIIPPYFDIQSYSSKEHTAQRPVFTIPYGVLSLAAYIKEYSKDNIQVEIIDLNLETVRLLDVNKMIEIEIQSFIQSKMNSFKPDIVGISALFNTCYNYLDIVSDSVKKTDPNVLIVIGGGLATNLYREILDNFEYIDACCYGEGEIPLCELLNTENVNEYFASSVSWVTKEKLNEMQIPQHTFVQNLDEIPFFDYNLIDLNNYVGRSLDKSYSNRSLREVSIHTSRGCPFNCVFCANGSVHGKNVRYMSVEKVINEVERMVNEYDMEILLIEDDHFFSKKDRAKKILKGLSELNLKIEFPNGLAVYAIDEEIGELLNKAGVKTISLAVESGSDFILKNVINKPHKVSMIEPAVEILRKNAVSIHAFIVIGLPGELEEHRQETMQMIFNVGFDWVLFYLAVPIAGSRLYEICQENDYLTSLDFSQYVNTKANIKTPDIDPEYIEEQVYLMNLEANFIKNFNLKAGNFEKASMFFKKITERYPDHAFAHFYLAKSYEGMGENNEAILFHMNRFSEIVKSEARWEHYASIFKLTA